MLEWFDDFLFTYQNLVYSLGIHGLLGLSMYVVLAVGQLSLGQAAFMGLGAYVSALMTLKLGLPFPVVLLASMLVPAAAALIIGSPTLRLSGVYLALATIGLGEVQRLAFVNSELTGGALGLSGIPNKGGLISIYGSLALALIIFTFVTRSKIGRAMEAMREDELAAGALGINLPAYKLGALVVSAMLAGLAGGLSAHVSSFISPNDYGFDAAVTILSFALLGGIGSPFAPVLGAFILTLLPEVLRSLANYRGLVSGSIIVLVVIFMPRGLLTWRMGRTGAPTRRAP